MFKGKVEQIKIQHLRKLPYNPIYIKYGKTV